MTRATDLITVTQCIFDLMKRLGNLCTLWYKDANGSYDAAEKRKVTDPWIAWGMFAIKRSVLKLWKYISKARRNIDRLEAKFVSFQFFVYWNQPIPVTASLLDDRPVGLPVTPDMHTSYNNKNVFKDIS